MQMKRTLINLMISALLAGCHSVPPVPPAPPVEVGEVVQQDVRHYLEAIGNVREFSIVQIRPQVQGILQKVYVAQGSYVKAGDLLYEIDPRPYQAIYDQAKATLERDTAALEMAKNTLDRYTKVAKKDFIAPITFDQYKTNVTTAEATVALDKAALEQANINLGYCKIYSTINGKIGVFNIYPGNLVVVNDPNALVEIRQIAPIDIRFSIPQQDFQEVQKYRHEKDQKFDIFLPYDENRKYEGTLYFIDNHIDTNNGMILLKGMALNEDKELWPGEFVRVRLYTYEEKDALLVPTSAVVTGQHGMLLFLLQEDSTVHAIPVEVGQRHDGLAVVKGPIKAGDRVVKNGQLNLANGMKVTVLAKDKKGS